MLDGEVVEDREDDVETAEDEEETKTCCPGCFGCATGEDTEPVLIAFKVGNETNTNISLDNIEAVSIDQHPPLPTIEDHIDAAAKDITDNLNNVATASETIVSDIWMT